MSESRRKGPIERRLRRLVGDYWWRLEPPLHLVLNSAYIAERRSVRSAERFTRAQLDEFKLARLRAVCSYAYEQCTYYRSAFDDAGLDPARITSPSDIEVLPLLDKATVRENLEGLTARAVPAEEREYVTTGGSTGEPLGLYFARGRTYPRVYAYEWRQYGWGGVRFFERRAVLRGRVMQGQVERELNTLYLSVFELTEETASEYVRRLRAWRPRYIEAYPSAAYFLAEWLEKSGMRLEIPTLKAVFVTSEASTPRQIERIRSAFGRRVYNKYGNTELATIIGMCEHGNMHEFEDFSFSEYRADGEGPGEDRELVSTAFVNEATVLIRYRTGDRVTLTDEPCPCGRVMRRVDRVVGRSQDYLLGAAGQRITVAAINTHSDVYDGVAAFQYHQTTPGSAVVRVVPVGSLSEEQKARIIEEAHKRTAGHVAFSLEVVPQLPKSGRGKTSFILREGDR